MNPNNIVGCEIIIYGLNSKTPELISEATLLSIESYEYPDFLRHERFNNSNAVIATISVRDVSKEVHKRLFDFRGVVDVPCVSIGIYEKRPGESISNLTIYTDCYPTYCDDIDPVIRLNATLDSKKSSAYKRPIVPTRFTQIDLPE